MPVPTDPANVRGAMPKPTQTPTGVRNAPSFTPMGMSNAPFFAVRPQQYTWGMQPQGAQQYQRQSPPPGGNGTFGVDPSLPPSNLPPGVFGPPTAELPSGWYPGQGFGPGPSYGGSPWGSPWPAPSPGVTGFGTHGGQSTPTWWGPGTGVPDSLVPYGRAVGGPSFGPNNFGGGFDPFGTGGSFKFQPVKPEYQG